jgi:hypothetical protein
MSDHRRHAISKLTFSAFCVLFAAVAGVVLLAILGIIEKPIAPRLMGIVFGLMMMLMLTGNMLPKIVDPLRSLSRLGRSQRTIGWFLFLAGAALVAILPFLPTYMVAYTALVTGGSSLALAGALILGLNWEAKTTVPTPMALSQNDLAQADHAALLRRVAFDILHGIAWAFIFMSTATLWGKDDFFWVCIAFAVSIAVFSTAVRPMAAAQQ